MYMHYKNSSNYSKVKGKINFYGIYNQYKFS